MILLAHAYYMNEDAHELESPRPYPPLGILYLSAYLKRHGHEVDLFDSTFRTKSEFVARLEATKPTIVGIYANLMTRANAVWAIGEAKRHGAFVVAGGPEPASYASEYLGSGADVVVVGEGEETLREIVERGPGATLHDVKGIAFFDGDRLVTTPPRDHLKELDALPWPDREAIDVDRYVDCWRTAHGEGAVSLITARGCPYTCTWCSHGVYGHTHRRRSPESVADEVEFLLERYRPDLLWYADDVFTINRGWIRRYADILSARGIRVPFETITREDRLDEEMVERLAAMGCKRLWVGSESGSQRVLDAMQRRTDAARVREMVKLLRRHAIEAGLFVMLGYESEEMADIEETLRHVKEANPDRFLTTLAYPIKGTPYYSEVEDRIIAPRPWHVSSDRELIVTGRRSRRFYSFANRWMVSEVTRHRIRTRGGRVRERARSFVNAKIGRVGMWLTRNEVECG